MEIQLQHMYVWYESSSSHADSNNYNTCMYDMNHHLHMQIQTITNFRTSNFLLRLKLSSGVQSLTLAALGKRLNNQLFSEPVTEILLWMSWMLIVIYRFKTAQMKTPWSKETKFFVPKINIECKGENFIWIIFFLGTNNRNVIVYLIWRKIANIILQHKICYGLFSSGGFL